MKKIKALQTFQDEKNTNKFFGPGEIAEVEDGRAAELVARGLAEEIPEETPKPKKKASAKK